MHSGVRTPLDSFTQEERWWCPSQTFLEITYAPRVTQSRENSGPHQSRQHAPLWSASGPQGHTLTLTHTHTPLAPKTVLPTRKWICAHEGRLNKLGSTARKHRR